MKISYNWLKQFINTQLSPEEISKILTDIGLEVENLNKVESVPGGLVGLIIGHVKECKNHPNADRLKITQVALSENEDLQIVCGASNVAVGQKVVVAKINTTVYPISGEPFKIKLSKIRGEVSQGMICGAQEIGLNSSIDGILILDPSAPVGTPVKTYFKIEDDYCFEIGLTPNRADAASHLGVARDLGAYLHQKINMPSVDLFKKEADRLPISVTIEDTQACPRYACLTISNVTIKESPDWLKARLNSIDIKPINNVVDVTNYVLHELGQPLHAFDADFAGNHVFVKKCAEGTEFITLDGLSRKLSSEDLMICNTQNAMCMAGVLGGENSAIKSNTKNIFLESAWFNPVSIRKTSKRHGLKTDASFRYERGTDPEMVVIALKRAALLIKELATGEISSDILDNYPSPAKPFEIVVHFAHINRLIGKVIPRDEIKSILHHLQIVIKSETPETLLLHVPPFKVDVTREVDVIEEILRIHGYNQVEIPTQIKASLNYSTKPDKEIVQNQIADLLTANGFIEIVSNSLTKLSYSLEPEKAIKILNPLSTDLEVMRQSLLFSGLEAIAYNQNRKNTDLKLYEFGKIYFQDNAIYHENQRLGLFITGCKNSENWCQKSQKVSFYTLKSVVDIILKKLNIKNIITSTSSSPYLAEGLSYLVKGQPIVQFGYVSTTTLKRADISLEVFYADFDWDLILKIIQNNKIIHHEVSKFPMVRRDLSLLLDQSVTFDHIKQIAHKTEKRLLKEINVFDVYVGNKLPIGKKSYGISFLLQEEQSTLTDKQIDHIMQKLIQNFQTEINAEIRK